MESKNNGGTMATGPATAPKEDVDVSFTTTRARIAPPPGTASGSRPADLDAADMERLARRYGREAQLALEGLLYWGIRWPFELLAVLVNSGRKWEEDYYRPGPKRRVSLYDDET